LIGVRGILITRKACMDVHSFNIYPMSSPPIWISSELPSSIQPTIRVPIGRPRKERRRSSDEPKKDQTRASRVGSIMTCRNYFKTGHNARSCKSNIDPKSKYFTQ
ncbi:hypothetical protein Droror1_Dr00026481, partial [Drosera rotundifolia]